MTKIILRLSTVRARTGLSRSAIYDLIGKGLFPRQVRLGPRAVGWREAEIDAWLETRAPVDPRAAQ